MNKIHITYENLLGHKVRIVDEEYFVLHDIMVILERTREQSSWSGAKRKILKNMAYDPTFELIQKSIPVVRNDNIKSLSDVYVIHRSRMKEILYILKPTVQSKNYINRLNIWKQLYELF